MSRQSRSSRFLGPFESALQDYEKTTNIKLAKHPLAEKLQSCDTVKSVTTFLQSQAQEFDDFLESDRIMKSIENTVSTVCVLSETAVLRDTMHLVCPRAPMGVLDFLFLFCSHSHL